ncbi:MAG: hypothetical protein IPJ74_06990 [Saprospiraceae bacterium]|nr:hypothetical protein [Saprospiraceae bacterium]
MEESNEKNLFKRLFQIIPKHKKPMFESGNVFYVNEGIDEWTKSLNLADYVILIGGIGGTYSTYKLAIKENIPVFPFFDTKGDTIRVYKELYENWPSEVYKNIPKEEFFNLLSKEINSKEDVIEILNSIKYFIDKIKN